MHKRLHTPEEDTPVKPMGGKPRRAATRPTLEFCEKVLSVDPADGEQFEAFLHEYHHAYHLMREDNPALSREEACAALDAGGNRGVHWPDVFVARQFELRLIIDGLFRDGDEGQGIQELNGALITWQLPPQVNYDGSGRPRRAFHLYPDGASSGMHIFRMCLRDIYFHFDTLEKIRPNTRQILFGKEVARARQLLKQGITYAEVQSMLKQEFGKSVGVRQLQNLK